MNGPRRMLVIYLKLLKERRFGSFLGQNYYWFQAMNAMLELDSDDLEALNAVLDQELGGKDTTIAIGVLEEMTKNDKVSVRKVMMRSWWHTIAESIRRLL